MRWPPNKAWTSSYLREGFRHFVAINYGGEGEKRWVTLVAVLDGRSRLSILWEEMNDSSKWTSGWLSLSRDEANFTSANPNHLHRDTNIVAEPCLHPSKDSGLLIPSEETINRPWEQK